MKKVILLISIVIFWFSIFAKPISAQSGQDIVIVNPIRGSDFWNYNYPILDTPKHQYEVIVSKNLGATWLVRYDALIVPEVASFLKSLNPKQEVGLFLEITPTFAKESGVIYNPSPNWHYAKSVLLVGYSPEDRNKLLDQAFLKYKEIFGSYPKSVGAWWVDAYSLSYLKDKYNIEANLDVADQHSTDQYQVWGQYFSIPFYPSKSNALVPAQSIQQKIGVVTIQWATRDPFNSYGNGVFESTLSVQANDYLLHNLGTSYFEKLINIYPQTTVGLENDFSWETYGQEYKNQIDLVSQKIISSGQFSVSTMKEFAKKYQQSYPGVSPDVLIVADDPLGTSGKVVWYQTPRYRFGWFYNQTGSVIRDLREYHDGQEESCFKKQCDELKLAFSPSQSVDDVTFRTKLTLDEGKITDIKVVKKESGAEISYKNQSGVKRLISLLPNDIKIDEQIKPISFVILDVVSNNTNNTTQTKEASFNSYIEPSNISRSVIGFVKFIFITLIFFIIPGWVLSRNIIVSIPVGWALFTLAAFILGYLKLPQLIWLLPTFGVALLVRTGIPKLSIPRITVSRIPLILLIITGSFTWLLTTVKNGLLYNYGYGYWGPNGHDGIWHLSLIQELQKNLPPENPIFSGTRLYNYHYFYDLLIARSGALLGVDSQDLFFRFYPLVISLIIGVMTYHITKKISVNILKKDGKSAEMSALFATFFIYFGGSFGWVVSYFRNQGFGGESMFWSQQAISTLLNPPFAISVVFLLSGYFYLLNLKEKNVGKKTWVATPLIVLMWGTLIEFKAYGGVLVLTALGLVALLKLIRKDMSLLPLFSGCIFISLFVFLPNNIASSSLFVLSPLWLVDTMILFKDRLDWQRLYLAKESGNSVKVLFSYIVGIGIFLIGNLGSRVLGLSILRDLCKLPFLLSFSILGIFFSLLFIQKGTNWNTIQFFYYTQIALAIFVGLATGYITRLPRILSLITAILIVLLTIPTTLDTLKHYTPSRPPAKLSLDEIEALKFLKSQPDGIILTQPFDEKAKDRFSPPYSLYTYAPTAYISAFSHKGVFLEDTINLEILGIDYKGRLNDQKDFFRDKSTSKDIIKRNKIRYVYALKGSNFEADESLMGIKKIFDNESVVIFASNE